MNTPLWHTKSMQATLPHPVLHIPLGAFIYFTTIITLITGRCMYGLQRKHHVQWYHAFAFTSRTYRPGQLYISAVLLTNKWRIVSSTCVVLALVAGCQNCQPRPDSQQQQLGLFLSSSQCQQILHYCKYGLRDGFQLQNMHSRLWLIVMLQMLASIHWYQLAVLVWTRLSLMVLQRRVWKQ